MHRYAPKAAFYLAALVAVSLPLGDANAEGLLKPGEIVISSHDFREAESHARLIRIDPEDFDRTAITTDPIGAEDLVIGDPQTVYTIGPTAYRKSNLCFYGWESLGKIWEVDVRDGAASVFADFPLQDEYPLREWPGDIEIAPNGDLLVLTHWYFVCNWPASDPFTRPSRLLRFDRDTGAIVAEHGGPLLGGWLSDPKDGGRLSPKMDVGTDGAIYVLGQHGLVRIDPVTAVQEIVPAPTVEGTVWCAGHYLHPLGDDYWDCNFYGEAEVPPGRIELPISELDFGFAGEVKIDDLTGEMLIHVSSEFWRGLARFDRSTQSATLLSDWDIYDVFEPTTSGEMLFGAQLWGHYSHGLYRRTELPRIDAFLVDPYYHDPANKLVTSQLRAFKVVRPACSNGVDDDGDGDGVDLADPDCFGDPNRNRETSGCNDGVDNDNDGYVDLADSDCTNGPHDDGEIPECSDGVDNDDDGFPDRHDELHCPTAWDDGEAAMCADGVDNDGNGLIDEAPVPFGYPGDNYCDHPLDDCEFASCPPDTSTGCSDGYDGDNDGFIDLEDPDCNNNPFTPFESPSCDNGLDDDGDGEADLDDPECRLRTHNTELAVCNDQKDNDADGLTDFPIDPGCANIFGKTENPQCSNGVDDDRDGNIDFDGLDLSGEGGPVFPADPDCTSASDLSESPEAPHCSDGIDNDGDGFTDWGLDSDCRDPQDPTEQERRCSNAKDDDGDGLVDMRDPNCTDPEDNTESARQCSDGIDNDGDGFIDYPADPNCDNADDNTEKKAGCGTGPGMALIVFPFWFLTRRRRRVHSQQRWLLRATVASLSLLVANATSFAQVGDHGARGEGTGQFAGLSTAPEANFFSGAMSMSVPILIPPGRKNVTPDLKLSYSSSGGPGVFGYGWNLPLGTIERSTKHGPPRCIGLGEEENDPRDFVLMLSGGATELVDVEINNDNSLLKRRYRARYAESYIEAVADADPESPRYNSWTVRDRSGMTYRFSTEVGAAGQIVDHPEAHVFFGDRVEDDQFFQREPELPQPDCKFTSIWALTQMEDPNGNTVDIRYFKEGNTLYPEEILYGANPLAGLSQHPFKVVFSRKDRAVPLERSNRAGREQMARIIHKIEVLYKPQEGADYELVRTYHLGHTTEVNGYERLDWVDDNCEAGDADCVDVAGVVDLLPRQRFTYSTASFHHVTNNAPGHYTPPSLPAPGYNDYLRHTYGDNTKSWTYRDLKDMNGDGITDLVNAVRNSTADWTWYRGTPSGFAPGQPWGSLGRIGLRYGRDNGSDMGGATDNWIERDVLDITGDGIVDLVESDGASFAATGGWAVYPGYCTSDTSCGFSSSALHWPSPLPYVMYDGDGVENFQLKDEDQLLIDISGDGRVDLVHEKNVYLNTGSGFELAWDIVLPFKVLVSTVMFDFNADGLPDYLTEDDGTMYVQLNKGRGFGDRIPLGTSGPSELRMRDEGLGNLDTRADFFDVNADGLPDRVYQSGSNNNGSAWIVELNQGGVRLGPPQTWAGGSGHLRRDNLDIDLEDDGGVEQTSRTRTDLFDLNGDGFLDRVQTNGHSGSWTVHYAKPLGSNAPQIRPLLLIKAENGIGGVTEVTYGRSQQFDNTGDDTVTDLPFNLWVVTDIKKTDGIGSGWDSTQSISYRDGAFDSVAREFKGFREVTLTDSDGNIRILEFGQEAYERGKVLIERQYAGVQLIREETSTWATIGPDIDGRTQVYLAEHKAQEFDLTAEGDFDRCVLNRNSPPDEYGRVKRSCSLPCDGAPPPMLGMPPTCTGAGFQHLEGEVHTVTSWATPPVYSSVRERPLTIETFETDGQNQFVLLASKEFYYDGGWLGLSHNGAQQIVRGNLHRVRSLVDLAEDDWVESFNEYDAFGNIIRVVDPNWDGAPATADLHSAFSDFDGPFSLYPSAERNALGHEVEKEVDLRFGRPTRVVGVNGEVGITSYDGLGRPLCEAGHGETLNNCHSGTFTHSKEYVYHRGALSGSFEDKLSYVEVRTREPGNENGAHPGYLVARQYTDAFGRKRVATGEVLIDDDTGLTTIVAEHIVYDAGGRASKKLVPYKLDADLEEDPSGKAHEAYQYSLNGGAAIDPRGRVHLVTQPDGREVRSYYEARRTRVVRADGSALENETRAFEDHFGNVVRKESAEGEGGVAVTFMDNTYDGMGRVLTEVVSGSSGTAVVHAYDLLGREVLLVDPDSGGWEFGYDKNGNTIYRDDPILGQHIQWLYDNLGRVTHVCMFENGDDYVALTDGCGSGIAESVHTYDDPAVSYSKGRLTRVEDLSGFEMFEYNERGLVVEQTRSIGGPGKDLGGTDPVEATMAFTYDEVDRVKTTTYPDGQKLTNFYNKAGRLARVDGDGRKFVGPIQYDRFGRIERVKYANGIEDIRAFHGEDENFRLSGIRTVKGGDSYLDLGYEYNDLAKVSRIRDHRDSNIAGDQALSNDTVYTYDPLGRLTLVDWLPGVGGATAHDDAFLHSSVGNVTEKGRQELRYGLGNDDCLGNIMWQPHRLASHGSTCFSYDENGNRVQKGSGANAQYYGYDVLGRLTRIDFENGDTVQYRYDYSGRRVGKRVNSEAWTRYFSDAFESSVDEAGASYTKYYFAGDSRFSMKKIEGSAFVDGAFAEAPPLTVPTWVFPGCALVVFFLLLGSGGREVRLGVALSPARVTGTALLVLVTVGPAATVMTGCGPPKPLIEYYHVDHLGSTQAVTDSEGDLIHQVRYAPYGEVRGRFNGSGAPLGDTDDYRHEFTGYETEIESGLMYAGARYYDPETAQFLSHDPERQYASPYAYGPGDPMNGTDPDGRFWEVVAAVLVIAGGVAAGIDAYRATGSFGDALKAAGMSLGVSLVTMGVFSVVAPVATPVWSALSPLTQTAIKVGMIGYQAYGVVQNARNGQYASALVGAASIGLAAHGVAKDVGDAWDFNKAQNYVADPNNPGTYSGLPLEDTTAHEMPGLEETKWAGRAVNYGGKGLQRLSGGRIGGFFERFGSKLGMARKVLSISSNAGQGRYGDALVGVATLTPPGSQLSLGMDLSILAYKATAATGAMAEQALVDRLAPHMPSTDELYRGFTGNSF